MTEGMKIISLEAENIKRLTAIEIHPDSNLVEITGRNGQGKTSVLDSIWWALCGASVVQKAPIRNGAETAFVRLDLGDLKVTRQFKRKADDTTSTSITVENADGAKYSSPQRMIDEMIGAISFDPLAFERMSDAERMKTIRSLAGDFDFDASEKERREYFSDRTTINREKKAAQNTAAEMEKNITKPYPPKMDMGDLIDQLNRATEKNDLTRRQASDIRAREEDVERKRERLAKLESEIAELKSGIAFDESVLTEMPEPGELVDTDAISAKMKDVEQNKLIWEQIKRCDEYKQKAKACEQRSNELTMKIDELKRQEREAVATIDLPIDGLNITEDGVMLSDVPFEQASDAERLRTSIAIAMALNPKLKVIRVRDGSLLDDDSMAELKAMADERDYQIWIERVDSSGTVGFVIEDGHLKTNEPIQTNEPSLL